MYLVTNQVLLGLRAKVDAALVESDNLPEVDMAHWLHDDGSSISIAVVC